ncbi:synaptobrevin domain-containing protein [Ditylenchus destructor]|uniref:Synaptobrevin domain-containing protein n=1 Tax=Ditylenchus destructor TaxID=166010 RepID=A0AAD4QV37_9BILA|nr:synaptobrevin domain-containing protein [Ditylenchus destructor]
MEGQPGSDNQGQSRPSNKRLQQTQAQVDEVVGIMKVNVEKVLERDQKLSQLDDRADALQEGASQFEKSAATLKRKYWWKNIKMIIIMCAIVILLVIIIVIWAGGTSQSTSLKPKTTMEGQPGSDGQGEQPARSSNKRVQQAQAQVREVADIMKVNMDRILNRDQKLSQLDDRADALQEGASQFERSAATLKRKYWWKNIKMMIIMGVILILLVIIIAIWSGSGK